MATYFAVFMPLKEGGYSVEFPDIPEAFTERDTLEECLTLGNDVLRIAAEEYAKARKDMPRPSTPEQIEKWAKKQKGEPGIDASRRTRQKLLQLFRAPAVDMTPVRVSVSFPKSTLEEIDAKAGRGGFTRSGFLAYAAQQYHA